MADLNATHPIEALDFPARVRNALARAGITTLEELTARSDAELLALRGYRCGRGWRHESARRTAWPRKRNPPLGTNRDATPLRSCPGGGLR